MNLEKVNNILKSIIMFCLIIGFSFLFFEKYTKINEEKRLIQYLGEECAQAVYNERGILQGKEVSAMCSYLNKISVPNDIRTKVLYSCGREHYNLIKKNLVE